MVARNLQEGETATEAVQKKVTRPENPVGTVGMRREPQEMGTPRQLKKDGANKAAQDVTELKDYVIFLQWKRI